MLLLILVAPVSTLSKLHYRIRNGYGSKDYGSGNVSSAWRLIDLIFILVAPTLIYVIPKKLAFYQYPLPSFIWDITIWKTVATIFRMDGQVCIMADYSKWNSWHSHHRKYWHTSINIPILPWAGPTLSLLPNSTYKF